MCGRFTLTINPADLQEAYSGAFTVSSEVAPYIQPRFNIAPSNQVAVVANSGENRVELFRWGLIPSWAKLPKTDPTNPNDSLKRAGDPRIPDIGNRLINARGETLDQKPSFRTAYRKQRCLILADGFYEWALDEQTNAKIPHFFYLKASGEANEEQRQPFAFAGLWDRWLRREDGAEILTCTIITTTPNDVVGQYHARMPVILPPEHYAEWLSQNERRSKSAEDRLIVPYTFGEMGEYPVSRYVNSPDNDDPRCIMGQPN